MKINAGNLVGESGVEITLPIPCAVGPHRYQYDRGEFGAGVLS